jgi:hypothetical protein
LETSSDCGHELFAEIAQHTRLLVFESRARLRASVRP